MSICPCRAGMRKRPWQVPSSSSNIVNVVRRSAWASSASRARPSNFSARSGAITSKIRPPRIRSALASWCSASATRCSSAAFRCSVLTANSPVAGSLSRAATMARAWAVLTRPSAIAADRTSCRSRAWARRRSERASRRTCRVSTAIQSAAVPAPVSVVAPERSASASRRSLSASSCPWARVRVVSASRCCSGLIDQSGDMGHRVEPLVQPVGEVEHRVEVVDRLAAHDSIQAPTTDRKGPLTCGFAHSARQTRESFWSAPGWFRQAQPTGSPYHSVWEAVVSTGSTDAARAPGRRRVRVSQAKTTSSLVTTPVVRPGAEVKLQ